MISQQKKQTSAVIGPGRFLGVDQLAGVGSAEAVFFLMVAPVMGLCNGFSIPVAQRFGSGQKQEVRRFSANAGWLCLWLAVLLTLVTMLLFPSFLILSRQNEKELAFTET